jgi:hypothetical protein
MPADNISALLQRYEEGVHSFEQALNSIPADEIDKPSAPGEWAPRQLALHILDAEIVGAARLRMLAAQPGSLLKGYAGDVWGRELHYETQPLDYVLDLFRLLRLSTLAMLRGIPEAAWANRGVHEESGEVTLESYLSDQCAHAEAHIGELEQRRPHKTSTAA